VAASPSMIGDVGVNRAGDHRVDADLSRGAALTRLPAYVERRLADRFDDVDVGETELAELVEARPQPMSVSVTARSRARLRPGSISSALSAFPGALVASRTTGTTAATGGSPSRPGRRARSANVHRVFDSRRRLSFRPPSRQRIHPPGAEGEGMAKLRCARPDGPRKTGASEVSTPALPSPVGHQGRARGRDGVRAVPGGRLETGQQGALGLCPRDSVRGAQAAADGAVADGEESQLDQSAILRISRGARQSVDSRGLRIGEKR
jgi:hypothetical protein